MSEMRSVLYAADAAADYSAAGLREQMEKLDLHALNEMLCGSLRPIVVFAHAIETLEDGLTKHPMQAFLHAAVCPTTGVELSDAEFFELLKIWGQWCAQAQRAVGE